MDLELEDRGQTTMNIVRGGRGGKMTTKMR